VILLIAVALSIAVALVRGGRLARLAEINLRHGWVALVALGIQLVIVYARLPEGSGLWNPRMLLLAASYALLMMMVVLNRHLPGMWMIGVGLAMNLAAMMANGGWMPVSPEALERAGLGHLAELAAPGVAPELGARVIGSKDIVLTHQEARIWMLGDVFVLPQPVGVVFSVGDVLLALGAFIFFQHTLWNKRPLAAAAIRDSSEGA